ncbi:MAG TPA: hypothetical protein VLW88_13075 [Hyphomicrobium sp.]|jgi:hypothetical protein|nr:hypothetical protein [Hyphomicrobium sp.]
MVGVPDRVKLGQVWAGTHPVSKKQFQDAIVINVSADDVEVKFLDGTPLGTNAKQMLAGSGWRFVREA